MQTTSHAGRHRKPSPARAIAARTALSAAGAAAALLVAAGTATAGTSAEVAAPAAEAPCTNTPLDAIIGPLAQTNCNDPAPSAPDDVTGDDPTDEGSGNGSGDGASEREGQPAAPGVPFPGNGGNPPGA